MRQGIKGQPGMRQRSLRSLLFRKYFLVSLVLWLCMEAFLYVYLYRENYHRVISGQTSLCNSIYNSLEESVDSLDNVNLNLIYSHEVQAYFVGANRQQGQALSPLERQNEALACASVIRDIKGFDSRITQVNLYVDSADITGSGFYSGLYHISSGGAAVPWLEQADAAGGARVVSGLHTFEWIGAYPNRTVKISVVRRFRHINYGFCGYVETTANCSSFFSYIDSIAKNGNTVYIYNAAGACIYPYQQQDADAAAYYAGFIDPAAADAAGVETAAVENGEIISSYRSENQEFGIVLVSPVSIIWQSFRSAQLFLLVFLVLVLTLSLLLSYLLADQIASPLQVLCTKLKAIPFANVAELHPKELSIQTDIEEWQEVVYTVNWMKNSLVESAQKEIVAKNEQVHAQLLAVQSQMNPHFLYNNLTNLSVMAEEGMDDRIVSFCANLSSMLRYMSASAEEGVFLGQEVEYTEQYFYCLKVRYEDKIDMAIDLPAGMERLVVPKMILQPLVENASKYALNTAGPWHIRIGGGRNGGAWEIYVEDSGKGFSPESLERFRAGIADYEKTKRLPNLSIHGMGLLNIYVRMRLFFGGDSGMRLENQPGGGGRVTLRFSPGTEPPAAAQKGTAT